MEESIKKQNTVIDPAWVDAENRRMARQARCPHDTQNYFSSGSKWSRTCVTCKLVIGSDATEASDRKWIEHVL